MTLHPRLLTEATIGIIVIVAAFWGAHHWLPDLNEEPVAEARAVLPEQFRPSQRWEGGP